MKDRTHVWFAVHDYTVDSSVVTELMRCQPSNVLSAGKPKLKIPQMISCSNLWQLNSHLPPSAHVEEHLEVLLSLLESRAEAIATLLSVHQAEAGINCAIYYWDFTPGIHLSQSITLRIATLGLYVDLDLYFLGEAIEQV